MDRKVFITLFFSIFATVTGVGIVVPLLPVYAHDLGAGGVYIGLIFGAFSLSRTVFLPIFGRRSDRSGRKPYIVIGMGGYTLISFAFMWAGSVESLIFVRFIQGIASAMIMPVTQAYVGDITPEDREGTTMGYFNMSTFIGLSIGPFVGGILHDSFGLNVAFAAMGALSGIGFILSLVLLPPAREERVVTQGAVAVKWTTLAADRHIAGLLAYRLVYTACIGTIWGFLPVFASAEFSLSSAAIGVLVMLGVLTSGILQTPMGYLSDRSDKRGMIVLGGLIVVHAMLAFERATGFWGLFAANVLFGTGGAISMAPLMAIAVRKGAQYRAMGAVMALLTMSHSLGMLSGAFFAGLLMDLLALRQTFFFAGLLMILGTAVFALLVSEKSIR